MARAYSMDLRERVVRTVKDEGLSRRQGAERFNIGISTAILWLQRGEGDLQREAWEDGRLQAAQAQRRTP